MVAKTVAVVIFMLMTRSSAAVAADEEVILRCSGTSQNETLDQERIKAPLDAKEVEISLDRLSRTATLTSAKRGVFSTRDYPIIQWGALVVVLKNGNSYAFLQRETGEVTITTIVNEDPGPPLFQLRCKRVSVLF